MNKFEFALGWSIGLLLQLPLMLIFKVDMTWFIFQGLGLLTYFVILLFSKCELLTHVKGDGMGINGFYAPFYKITRK